MGKVILEDEVRVLITASSWHEVETVVPSAGHDVVSDDHVSVALREGEATLPAVVLEHLGSKVSLLDHMEDPVSIDGECLGVRGPDTVLSEVSDDVVDKLDVGRGLDDDTWGPALVNGRVRDSAGSHDGVLKLEG